MNNRVKINFGLDYNDVGMVDCNGNEVIITDWFTVPLRRKRMERDDIECEGRYALFSNCAKFENEADAIIFRLQINE